MHFREQSRAGIGKPRHARIRNNRDIFSGGETLDQFRRAHRFVVFVITNERLSNLEMLQQISGMPRIFGRDNVDRFQHLERAQRDVIEIADRRRDHVKHRASSFKDRRFQNSVPLTARGM